MFDKLLSWFKKIFNLKYGRDDTIESSILPYYLPYYLPLYTTKITIFIIVLLMGYSVI